jgi:short-subunit dehydrogenase
MGTALGGRAAGQLPRAFSGVYNLTKHGVGAFSEALRQELAA